MKHSTALMMAVSRRTLYSTSAKAAPSSLATASIRTPAGERGSALMIAMVMIFMLSIMGISAMRGSTLEHRMAANSVQAATSFQAAESSTDIVLNEAANLDTVWRAASQTQTFTTDLQHAVDGLESSVVLTFVGTGPALGASLGGRSGFTALRFEAEGQSSIDSVRSRATVRQGAYRKVPRS